MTFLTKAIISSGVKWGGRCVPMHCCRVEKCWPRFCDRRSQTTGETGTTRRERWWEWTHWYSNMRWLMMCAAVCRSVMVSSTEWEQSLWGSKWEWRRMRQHVTSRPSSPDTEVSCCQNLWLLSPAPFRNLSSSFRDKRLPERNREELWKERLRSDSDGSAEIPTWDKQHKCTCESARKLISSPES